MPDGFEVDLGMLPFLHEISEDLGADGLGNA